MGDGSIRSLVISERNWTVLKRSYWLLWLNIYTIVDFKEANSTFGEEQAQGMKCYNKEDQGAADCD